MNKFRFHLKPAQIILLGFAFIILAGGLLLSLPISSKDGSFTPLLDSFFTAASACCVTGLTVVNTAEHWSLFGQIIILLLIQVGGLGFMTLITTVLVVTGRRITLKDRRVIQESLNLSQRSGIVRFVKFLMKFTFTIELIGAGLLTIRFLSDYKPLEALWMGIFHSVSAFCNAGFDVIGQSSLMPYAQDTAVNIIIILLVVMGGLGFPVWVELGRIITERKTCKYTLRQKISRLSLHTKLVLTATAFLIISGTVFTFLTEHNNPSTMGGYSLHGKILASLFHSVALRTAGFVTIDYSGLKYATEFFSVILMMIGGSPCGTAGGIKTISVTVIILAVMSLIKDKDSICAFKRSISIKILQKALAVTIIMLTLLILSATLLSITEVGIDFEYEFLDLIFESASALGTVGSTTGITPHLTQIGKVIIMFCMFTGRLGPITIAISFTTTNTDKNKIHYPNEDILVG